MIRPAVLVVLAAAAMAITAWLLRRGWDEPIKPMAPLTDETDEAGA